MIILKEMSQDREELPPKVSLKSTLELPIEPPSSECLFDCRLLNVTLLRDAPCNPATSPADIALPVAGNGLNVSLSPALPM